ncbi:hypothetical protein IT774_03890 [Salinimonas marina]|uniref:Curli production assembly/transport component CsgG n=1 Tax=Salinimonas marina TaxID=2785918 RepID=A0A7S9HE71_9ALTE|nr:CsgG/HfaB family protein [Salinimonas marina]QPG06346.1 hypothetical protein IT774_03890 [Salinimonas marina]
MRIFKLAGIAALLVSFNCTAAAGTMKVEVQGYGQTEHQALEDALSIAVGQFHGVDIDHQQARKMMQGRQNGELTTLQNLSGATEVKAKGHVKSYAVTNMSCENRCIASLDVYFDVYEAPGNNQNRRRIVVAPFEQDPNNSLSKALQRTLVSSRRFAVLDRQHNDEYAREADLLLSKQVPAQERIRLGQVLGLDYLIAGNIEFSHSGSGEASHSLTGEAVAAAPTGVAHYQIILLATRQIMKEAEVALYGPDDMATAGEYIAQEIVDAIYPLQVVHTAPDQITVNAGQGFLQQGDEYTVYQKGKKLRDPYNKESLGYLEKPVGRVVITQVKPKYALAAVLEGDGMAMDSSILRRAQADNVPQTRDIEPASLDISTSGGVVLPLMKN